MNLALFDFDGTITTGETFGAFVRYAAPAPRVAIGRVVLAPWVVGYRLGWVAGPVVRARVVSLGFTGLPAVGVHASGRRFAEQILPGLVRPEALERIDWHKSRGDTIAVVSGAFDCFLSHWCEQHGLDSICSSLEVVAGRLTGRYRGAQCVGAEKVRRIRERYDLAAYDEIHAYGDTSEDHDMLALASRRIYRWKEAA